MPNRPKIMCLGPNKSGTTSLHHFFIGNGLRSVHHGGPDRRHNIAHVMLRNASVARPLLTGLEQFDAFSDITFNDNRLSIDAAVFTERLMDEYPDAYFIYNHRPRDAWVQSRARHFNGRMLRKTCKCFGMTEAEVLEMWAAYHTAHGSKVRAAAARNGMKFLDFNVGADDPAQVVEFLRPDYEMDLSHWGHANKAVKLTWRWWLKQQRAKFT